MAQKRTRILADLPNLGPRSAEWLEAAGIRTEAELRKLGAAEAYRRVKARFPRQVSAVLLYALHGALTGVHWNDFPPELKARMRAEAEDGLATPRRRR